jgi:putative transposase
MACQKESFIEEGHVMPDHMMISIPPKHAILQVVRFIKGTSAIHVARTYVGRKKNYVGQHFWARGYFVSTVSRDEQMKSDYILHQEQENHQVDQFKLL